MVAGSSEELMLSESTDATAEVKGFLKEETKVQFWLVLETKPIGKE